MSVPATRDTAALIPRRRNPLSQYFSDLWIGIVTILEGMWVTFSHLPKRTITVQYPKEKVPMYPQTRAMLVNHVDDCGYCLSCKRVCPVNIFTITGVRADPGEDLGILPDGKPKKMHIVDFKIDMSKCVYCGLCVEACDTRSLRWEQPQEKPVYNRRDLHLDFSGMTAERKQELLDRDEARKKAKAAEAAAKAAAPKVAPPKPTSESGTASSPAPTPSDPS
jgi:NADH-quinone oxidoreductase subunit I